MQQAARQFAEIAAPFGATVLVSGDVDMAVEAGAAGVHLTRGGDPGAARHALGPTALIGISAHDLAEAAYFAARTVGELVEQPSEPFVRRFVRAQRVHCDDPTGRATVPCSVQ